jgi:hypothetical protein
MLLTTSSFGMVLALPYLHTSAYVSIRQHMSAYVSNRQHAPPSEWCSPCHTWGTPFLSCQYLYFCTNKASELNAVGFAVLVGGGGGRVYAARVGADVL